MTKRQLKSLLYILALLTLILVAVLFMTGCNQAQYEEFQAAIVQLDEDIEGLKIGKAEQEQILLVVDQGLADVRTRLSSMDLTDEQRAEAEAKLASLEEARDKLVTEIDKINTTIDKGMTLAARIAAAPTPEEAWAQAIGEIGAVATPIAGPYGVWVALVSSIASAVVGAYGAHKRTLRTTTKRIILPIELARARNEESANTIVVDRDKVAMGHRHTGMADLIEKITKVTT
jgi:Tfp pilus assembly protein PilN